MLEKNESWEQDTHKNKKKHLESKLEEKHKEGMNDYKGREGESSVVVRKRFKEKQQQQQQQPFPSTRAIINQQHRRCASLPNNTQYG